MKKLIDINNERGKYSRQGDYTTKATRFEVIKETEKAVKVERFIESKGKSYLCWIPKAAFQFKYGKEDQDGVEFNALKKWFWKRMDGFTEWLITAN